MKGGGVGVDLGAETQVLPLGHDGHAVVAQGAAQEDGVPRPGSVAGDLDALRHHAQAGGGDEDAVRLAALDDLGVARHHRHSRLVGGPRHALHQPRQIGQGEAFLQDEARGQVQGPGAGHGDVVDGAMHRQAADVAAREEQRRDDMPVRAHHQAPRRRQEHRLIVALAQQFIVQVALKEVDDELGHGPPAATMGHVHRPAFDVEALGKLAWFFGHD